MTRLSIDHDADGAYAVITRPGQAAERVDLTHAAVARLAAGAMGAWLAEEAARKMTLGLSEGHSDDAPVPFIGDLGE